ncbi:alpha-glucan family phosphorylase [Corynebacterium sp. H113]|uniref:alpha-glucan family phosphorylase n=1 Tax=Corynebacterium sp. H113 TaxID=3133419 RepID=UPI003097059A
MKATGTLEVSYNIPSALEPLVRLAMNLRWSWHRPTRELFENIDQELWASTRNPMEVLHKCSQSRLAELAADEQYLANVRIQADNLDKYLQDTMWFQSTHEVHQVADRATTGATNRTSTDPVAAYFSMEFGIDPSLPIYSGGLGVLAGDHMKSASDLGVPLIGIGLLYTFGYFTQSLSTEGWQEESYFEHPPVDLPVLKVTDESGEQIIVNVDFPDDRTVAIALWVAQVGRVPLLLLDTNIPQNPDDLRGITDRLYGGDNEHRIRQELVLGVGGVRAVNAFCDSRGLARPRVAHLNEGHAGFLGLERIRERMDEGNSYEESLAIVRAGNIFTTHTPVPAGIDRFDMELVRRYVDAGGNGTSKLCPGVPVDRALDLGREQDPHRFNMAHMGLRLSQRANGVAKLHGVVSRDMFQSLYPGYEPAEVPIGSVTNGVHLPTWVNSKMEDIVARVSEHKDITVVNEWNKPDAVTNEEFWAVRNEMRADLVEVAREATHKSWLNRGLDEAQLSWTRRVLDPNVLTVGFARRVSTYKRLTLMLKDPQRLRSILLNEERPVQFVIAGKAHPHDMGGKQLMQEIIRFADEAGVRDRFLFLPDYDIELASYLISGSDIWLNNPVRPQEASGTSGMKAVMNGCMTLSISDGWWDEMPKDETGWTIPTVDSPDFGYRDQLESQAMYDLLENEIAPLFYDRDESGVPQKWMDRVRESFATLSPKVTSTRMVRDYTEGYYRPADHAIRLITADGDTARQFVNWTEHVHQAWPNLSLTHATCEGTPIENGQLAGQDATICVDLELGTLAPDDITVQAIVGKLDANGEIEDPEVYEMTHAEEGRYTATVNIDVPGGYGYTVRAVPNNLLLANPAETGLITYANENA